ncbi:hypothetical protein BCR32DRAFT_330819 [Anaeromyces robustus]|uniref:Uncharacterized protein n=1 Tax=Anaeromyces robustus TaxID=1754192 RepID=A0A1Y1VQZ0_9FUNG|nr:hypothetical protein BCR32DRAFT_330819 [Anaeromyces robustus]|eukprot:ORX63593.1 hypothetical protein BCR32DRAFT_330819 [Anaeromyces robustus]
MKKYAQTIPKPSIDPKLLLKEKISQALDKQQQKEQYSFSNYQDTSSNKTLSYNGEEWIIENNDIKKIDKNKENNDDYQNNNQKKKGMIKRMSQSHIPIRKKKNNKKKNNKNNTNKKKANQNKYSNLNNDEISVDKNNFQKDNENDNNISNYISSSTITSSINNTLTDISSIYDTENIAFNNNNNNNNNNSNSNNNKESNLVLPPISPTQLQLWNLEQEYRKAMDKVENIKKELNL